MPPTSTPFSSLSKVDILNALPEYDFSREARRRRSQLDEELASLPPHEVQILKQLVQSRETAKAQHKQQRRQRYVEDRRVRARLDDPESNDGDEFLHVATPEEIAQCHADFIEATSNAALATEVCVVCARECPAADTTACSMDDLPNGHLLENQTLPADCRRYRGHVLLVERLTRVASGTMVGRVCNECLTALEVGKSPKYALGNGLWIGDIPQELRDLTLPEQLLIGLQFPRVFFYKLRPKDRGAPQNPDQRQRAMVGNVVSFACNTEKVLSMLTGELMPRPPALLASVIAVSYIGKGRPPKRWLNQTFRVRRHKVYEGLLWLKRRNDQFLSYTISEERLNALPEDGVPYEIAANIRQSEDETAAARESETYVPDDNDPTGEYGSKLFYVFMRDTSAGSLFNLTEDDECADDEPSEFSHFASTRSLTCPSRYPSSSGRHRRYRAESGFNS